MKVIHNDIQLYKLYSRAHHHTKFESFKEIGL